MSRKFELIVARAAGVSVWQFLVPPVAIALLIGILSVTMFNPISAEMKQRADAIETQLFGRSGQQDGDTSLWIRQRSVDGEAILRAAEPLKSGTTLTSVTAYVYEPDGRFEERVQAERATLCPGVWKLQNAQVSAPGEEARQVGTYLLATDLSPDQLYGKLPHAGFCPILVPAEACARKASRRRPRFDRLSACNSDAAWQGRCCWSRWFSSLPPFL